MKNLSFILAVFMFFNLPVSANESLTANIKHVLKHSYDANYFSVVISLGVVILLIYITGIIYAKLNVFGHNTMKKQYINLEDTKLLILSTTPIGNNKSLMVVELAGKKMLIGVTNENISLIKDLDEKDNNKNKDSRKIENISSELSKKLPIDKIYPQEKVSEEIEFKSNIPDENEEKTKYDSEEFGLYKKYLDD